MAYLILNGERPHGGPDAENYYEFDPSNEAALERIEALLCARKAGSMKTEAILAEHCAASMEENAAKVRKATLFGWMEILRNCFSRAGNKEAHPDRFRRGRFKGKRIAGRLLSGFRRRLSFV